MIITDTKTNATLELSALGFSAYPQVGGGKCLDPYCLDFLVRYTAPDGSVARGGDPGLDLSRGEAAAISRFFAAAAALAPGEGLSAALMDNTVILVAERLGADAWLLDAEACHFADRAALRFHAVQTDVTRRQLLHMADEWANVQRTGRPDADGIFVRPAVGF